MDRRRRHERRKPHARMFLAMSPMGQVPVDRARRRTLSGAIERDHPLSGARQRTPAGRSVRGEPRSTSCCSGSNTATSPMSPCAASRWSISSAPRKSARKCGWPRGDAALDFMEQMIEGRDMVRRRALQHRRHRASRLYAICRTGRLRSVRPAACRALDRSRCEKTLGLPPAN